MGANREIIKAMSILFGSEFNCSERTLQYLQPSGIKKAFRSKALLYHPDHAVKNGANQIIEFHELQDAYQLLMDVKLKKERIYEYYQKQSSQKPKTNNHQPKTTTHQKPKQESRGDFYYQGCTLPRVNLRLGEYLYYSGRISWRTLINAIVEQRKCGSRLFGEYFIRRNMLNRIELEQILIQMRRHNFSLKGA